LTSPGPVLTIPGMQDAAPSETVREVAQALLEALETRTPIDPVTKRWPDVSLEAAYAVQLRGVKYRVARGGYVKGHKVGLTSHAMQRMLGVDEPDYGHLIDDMFHCEGDEISATRFVQPRVEPELAFVLSERLVGPGATVADAGRAVESVHPTLEIIDSRIRDWRITLIDTIADNASSGGVVLGARASKPHAGDLATAGCILTRNGELVETGAGGAVLGHPLAALVWLANTLGERGEALERGQVVLSGACTRAVAVEPGDVVVADFGKLGSATAVFASAKAPNG